MKRAELVEACARAIVAAYDPYELMDHGTTEHELYGETLRLIETEPETIIGWLMEV